MSSAAKWIDLEIIILSEESQTKDWDHLYVESIFLMTSLAVQWLEPYTSTMAGRGSISGWGSEILCVLQHGKFFLF